MRPSTSGLVILSDSVRLRGYGDTQKVKGDLSFVGDAVIT